MQHRPVPYGLCDLSWRNRLHATSEAATCCCLWSFIEAILSNDNNQGTNNVWRRKSCWSQTNSWVWDPEDEMGALRHRLCLWTLVVVVTLTIGHKTCQENSDSNDQVRTLARWKSTAEVPFFAVKPYRSEAKLRRCWLVRVYWRPWPPEHVEAATKWYSRHLRNLPSFAAQTRVWGCSAPRVRSLASKALL